MRLVEKCSCGASLELIWEEPASTYAREKFRESERATKELSRFQRAHKTCIKQARTTLSSAEAEQADREKVASA